MSDKIILQLMDLEVIHWISVYWPNGNSPQSCLNRRLFICKLEGSID